MISVGCHCVLGSAEKSGCVAVENTMVQRYFSHSAFTAATVGRASDAGRLCASSKSTTLFAMWCSLRQL